MPEIRRILALNALALFDFQIATAQQDIKEATDMVITTSGQKAIAVRIRRSNVTFRDLTIRAYRTSGATTELEKIKEGAGDYYLYAWEASQSLSIGDWVLVDLHRLRHSGLLDHAWRRIANTDRKTEFIAIPVKVLREYDCVISGTI